MNFVMFRYLFRQTFRYFQENFEVIRVKFHTYAAFMLDYSLSNFLKDKPINYVYFYGSKRRLCSG